MKTYREKLADRHKHHPFPTANNKLQARLYAQKFGLKTPDLYWSGISHRIPVDLPNTFVFKPIQGFSAMNVHVVGNYPDAPIDLFTHQPIDIHAIGKALRCNAMCEEYVPGDPIPFDYKFFSFKEHCPAVLAIDRRDKKNKLLGWYTSDWTPRPPVNLSGAGWAKGDFAKPANLDAMLEYASRITTDLGTFARVDLYDTGTHVYFGEVTLIPNSSNGVTHESNKEMTSLWYSTFGDTP